MMLTTTQAAKRLSVHPETIRRLVKAGKLKVDNQGVKGVA
jgi:excisionase family DNA binding protein